jgi:hypothetical protein
MIWMTLGVHLLVGFVPCWYLVMSENPSGIFREGHQHFVGSLYSPQMYNEASSAWENVPDGSFVEPAAVDLAASLSNVSAGTNVSGWCVYTPKDTADAAEDQHKAGYGLLDNTEHVGSCIEQTWTKIDSHHEDFDGYQGPSNKILDNGGTITQCAELPNRVSGGCSADADLATASCDMCFGAKDSELDSFVCYESKSNFTAWLPHDCGVRVTLRTLCQRCPSGCGPFKNKEGFFDVFTADTETWDTTSDTTKASANKFFISFFTFLASPPFTVLLLVVLIIVWAVKSAKIKQTKHTVEKLLRERQMDRIDKEYMLAEYGIHYRHQDDHDADGEVVGRAAVAHRKAAKEKAKIKSGN